ncbi:MAG: DUF7557 family protein [Candidatus Asgardarchaeia archaeon]
MSEITTIRVHRETKKRIDEVKVHPRETYEEVILRLIEKWKEQTRS